MATLTPPPTPTELSVTRLPPWYNWRGALVFSLLLTIILYVPAFFRADHDPAAGNLFILVTGYSPTTDSPDFMTSWQTAGQLIRAGQLPLWDSHSNMPLLEATQAPIFYPGSLLLYFGGEWGPLLFAGLHLFGLSFALSSLVLVWFRNRYLRGDRTVWLGMGLAVLFVSLMVSVSLAALPFITWVFLGWWLAEWNYRKLAWIALPVPAGMLMLNLLPQTTVEPDFILYRAAVAYLLFIAPYWFFRRGLKERTRLRLLQRLGLLLLCGIAGVGLAGPQIFPRQMYQENFFGDGIVSLPGEPPQISSGQLESEQVQPNGDLEVEFTLPPHSSGVAVFLPKVLRLAQQQNGLEITLGQVVVAYDKNWHSQLYQLDDKGQRQRKTGPSVVLENNSAYINFDANTDGGGRWLLQVRYQPFAFMLGLYAAFLVLLSQVMLVIVVGWVRFYREDENDHPLRRVVKNSATPMFAQLSGKVIDFTFALFLLRLLGPDGNGQWTFATTTWLFFATLCDFGLESLVTREVARVRSQPDAAEQVNRLFVTKLILRLIFSVAALPISLAWLGLVGLGGHLTAASFWAVVLLMIGFWPTAVVGSITVVFRGYEKFEYLAASQLLISVLRVPLGMAVLLAGWGPVGLAAVSILNNFVQLAILQNLLSRQGFRPSLRWSDFDWPFARQMLGQAFPLMLNGLIINVLFKSDGFALEALRGNTELGLYNSAYKFVDALLIIPSTLTFALFPLFSAYSENARENLLRAYHEGLRVLVIVALPIAAGTLFVAPDLIGFLGGSEFLPGGAIALQILIWFLPFSYINGITQYVLIAVDQQKKITRAVIVAALANVLLNLLLIPIAGYMASAALTILTELILLVPFNRITRDTLGPDAVPLWRLSWRPLIAALLMMAALGGLWLLGLNQFIVSVVVGAVVYLAGLALTRAVTRQDLALLKKVIRR